MDLERLAISEIEKSISKTERLTTFINSGDKEPCWDGHVYIHGGKQYTKKDIKRVAVQVKSKSVLPRDVKDEIKYTISYDDLDAYIKDGGVIFFIVYIDKYDGEPLQIYFAPLLPLRIKSLLKERKRTYRVVFQKFPDNNNAKLEAFINFHKHSTMQASFALGEIPTIEELEKRGVLESLSISYTSIGTEATPHVLPRVMEGKSLTIYANVTGVPIPVPVEYHDKIFDLAISNLVQIPVSVAGEVYFKEYKAITTAKETVLNIGRCMKVILHNIEDGKCDVTIKVKIVGTLNERIKGMKFIGAVAEHKSFRIGDTEIEANFSEDMIESLNVKKYPELIEGYSTAIAVLKKMNVTKQLDFDNCNEEDIWKLNALIDAIENGNPIKNVKGNLPIVCNLKIANLWLVVICEKVADNVYNVWDYFNKKLDVVYVEDEKAPVPVPQYANMKWEELINVDNVSLDAIVDSYKHFEIHPVLLSMANMTMLELLKAYDRQLDKVFLNAAKQLCEWIKGYPEHIDVDVTQINEMQIVLRERPLSVTEKRELYELLDQDTDLSIRIGALLLLGYNEDARELLKELSDEEQAQFKEYPIYNYCYK